MTDCSLRRDTIWERQMKKLHLVSTPIILRLQAYTPATSHSPVQHLPSTPTAAAMERVQPAKRSHVSYKIPPSVPTSSSSLLTSSVSPTTSSFCARPPIHLKCPVRGVSSEPAYIPDEELRRHDHNSLNPRVTRVQRHHKHGGALPCQFLFFIFSYF